MLSRDLKVGPAVALKGLAGRDQPDQPLQVVAVGDEVVGQQLQARRVVRRERNVVDRLDERPAEEQRPDAVDRRPGEGLVVRMRDPAGKLLAAGAVAVDQCLAKGHLAAARPLLLGVEILGLVGFAAFVHADEAHARRAEERGQLMKIGLRAAVRRLAP